jgi:GTP-binding protein
MLPIIAIVGRPNVGKSTLFNRILGRRQAVVAEEAGVTRDRHYANCEWAGHAFTLIDTGGILESPQKPLEWEIRRQAEIAISEADAVLFIVDTRTGIHPDDEAIAEVLRLSSKKVVLVANKTDETHLDNLIHEFFRLGIGEPFSISALNGRNIGDMLEMALSGFPAGIHEEADDSLKIAVVGRPNVGKSSLVNALLDEERHIVDDNPGTTRDSLDSKIRYYSQEVTLIDTAGLRRAVRIKDAVEFFCSLRSTRAIERSDAVMVLFEASENLTHQDLRIVEEAVARGKGIALLANKWDLLPDKESGMFERFQKEVYHRLGNLDYIPLLTFSALTKQRIHRVLEIAFEVYHRCQIRIPTSELNDYLLPLIKATPPPAVEGRNLQIKYLSQVSIQPTVFAFHCNFPQLIPTNYQRFLERKLRSRYDFTGVPLRLKFIKK